MKIKDEVVEAAKRIRDTAMEQTMAARIPESGHFGAIAQDADWLVDHLTAALPHMGDITYEIENEEGEFCAGSNSLADAQHYTMVYGQDHPVRLIEVTRRVISSPFALASHEPTSEAQRGVEDAEKRIAAIPAGTLIDSLPDEVLFGDHSEENPTVRQPAPEPAKDGPEVAGWRSRGPKGGWIYRDEPYDNGCEPLVALSDYEALRAENERLRIERITAERDAADYMKRLNKAAGKLSIAENVIAELVKALEPFALLADYYDQNGASDEPAEAIVPNIGDLRCARAALSQAPGGKE